MDAGLPRLLPKAREDVGDVYTNCMRAPPGPCWSIDGKRRGFRWTKGMQPCMIIRMKQGCDTNKTIHTGKAICIGKILRPHGIRGWVKFLPHMNKPSDLLSMDSVFDAEGQPLPIIEDMRFFHGRWILKFSQIDDINDLTPWLDKEIFVTREKLPVLEPDMFYYEDLKGLQIVTGDQTILGMIVDVKNLGAEDLLLIRRYVNQHDVWMPFRKAFFPEIHLQESNVLISTEGVDFLEWMDA